MIGNVVLLRDVTEASHAMARTMILLVVLAIALIATGFVLCRWLLAAELHYPAPPPPKA